MKGEYVKDKDHSNMFAKLHQTQKFQQSPSHPPLHHHHFQLAREPQTSEETDSATPTTAVAKKETEAPPTTTPVSDGSTIEILRRPRGRPPGSKNKPKPPVIITRDSKPSMNPHVLELPCGVDIVESITRFCRNRNMGMSVLTGSGTVSNVTLRQPSTTPGATITFHGRFDILSISATVLPSSIISLAGPANGFTISLSCPQGQVVGGLVAGPLLTAGTVYVIAASFNSPLYHRLPLEEDPRTPGSGGNEGYHSPQQAVSGAGGGHPPTTSESCGMSIYSCHLPSGVIWAPNDSQPPPPRPY